MTPEDQKAGEARVRAVLIDPLLRRGLAKPSALTKGQFDEMIDDLCEKLAYMTEANLAALEEVIAATPAGKDRDRLPIANTILKEAGRIQPPADDASPLIRAIFAHEIGQRAIAQGWAPELLDHVRKQRKWPSGFALTQIEQEAAGPIRQMIKIDEARARGEEPSPDMADWRARRLARLDKCFAIGALSREVAR
jgi:hypothetical protein